MRDSQVFSIISKPQTLTHVKDLIKRYVHGKGVQHYIYEAPHPANTGMGPIVFDRSDPHGWLFVDFHLLAETIRRVELTEAAWSPSAGRLALELELQYLTVEDFSSVLQTALGLILPPASRYGRPQHHQAPWEACLAARGLSKAQDHRVGLYRNPYGYTKRGVEFYRCAEMSRFMQTCALLGPTHLHALPAALREVVQACGMAWTHRDRHPVTPVDDFGLSWTNTHLLYWKPTYAAGFETYVYDLQTPTELCLGEVMNRLKVDQDPEVVAFGAVTEAKQLHGLRLAAMGRVQALLDEMVRMPADVLGHRVRKKEKKAVPRKRKYRGVPTPRVWEFEAGVFRPARGRGALTTHMECLWRGDHMYVRVPNQLVGVSGLGDIDGKFAQLATRTVSGEGVRLDLRARLGDPITTQREGLVIPVSEDDETRGGYYSHPNGVFVRVDGFAQGAVYRECFMALYKKYAATMLPQARLRALAFMWLMRWFNEGADIDAAELTEKNVHLPLWLRGMTEPLYDGAPVVDTLHKRMAFFDKLTQRLDKPMLAYAPAGSKGRAPYKSAVENYLVAFGKTMFGRAICLLGLRMTEQELREAMAYLLMPWLRPTGLVGVDVRAIEPEDVDVDIEKRQRLALPDLMEELFVFGGVDMPPWAMSPKSVLENRYVRQVSDM